MYLTVYYVVDRSVSSRLMIEIENSPQTKLTLQEIKKFYDPDAKYSNEIKGMCEGGFIKKEGEYFSNSLKASIFAQCAIWYKKIFKLGEGG